jgi:hypothetical protein
MLAFLYFALLILIVLALPAWLCKTEQNLLPARRMIRADVSTL